MVNDLIFCSHKTTSSLGFGAERNKAGLQTWRLELDALQFYLEERLEYASFKLPLRRTNSNICIYNFLCTAVYGTVIRQRTRPQRCVEHLVLKNLHIFDIGATWTFILSSKALCKLKSNSLTVSVIGVS